ncbi:hypothetical protein N0V90_006207 [Kalmusia sp. IMI 367209]|nr:hypothetical protein N0V90_006207 [Kalmusia sp. IMI 367209]
MDGIASAVVLPEEHADSPPPTAPSPTGTKRRQLSISEHGAKRARLNGHDAPTQRRESVDSNAKAPAPPPKGRERGRERRLFGAALGALSQNSATAAQKRRTEIEQRQRAQRKLEEEESEQRKQERRAKRKAQRWKEHRQFETDSYYKPWETVPEEDDRIRKQIAEAHDIIRREREDYEAASQQHAERERHVSRDGHMGSSAEETHSGKEHNAETPPKPAAANGAPTNGSNTFPKNPESKDDHAEALAGESTDVKPASKENTIAGHEATDDVGKEAMDENGEEVVEAAEDTVIY